MWKPNDHETQEPEGPRTSTGSEVAVMSEMLPPEVIKNLPTVGSMNVTKNSRVHIGHKFVSVNQNINNTEVVKGRFLCLELESPVNAKRLRCSVAVFVCWALIVATGLGVYLVQLATQPTRLDVGINEPWFLRRDDWQAMKNYDIAYLKLPVSNVLIGHTATGYCNQKYQCIERMLEVQRDNLRRNFDDIVANFLVGGNGIIFEGRGANAVGAMVRSWNAKSISVMFMGNYMIDEPDMEQFKHVNFLLDVLVKLKVLTPDYVVYGHCQLSHYTFPPGMNIMHSMGNFSHWVPENMDKCRNKTV